WVFTGEQLAYLPLAALASIIAAGALALIVRVMRSRTVAEMVLVAASLLLVVVWSRPLLAVQATMRDEETVYRHTLAYSPSPRACFNLGVSLLAGGKP